MRAHPSINDTEGALQAVFDVRAGMTTRVATPDNRRVCAEQEADDLEADVQAAKALLAHNRAELERELRGARLFRSLRGCIDASMCWPLSTYWTGNQLLAHCTQRASCSSRIPVLSVSQRALKTYSGVLCLLEKRARVCACLQSNRSACSACARMRDQRRCVGPNLLHPDHAPQRLRPQVACRASSQAPPGPQLRRRAAVLVELAHWKPLRGPAASYASPGGGPCQQTKAGTRRTCRWLKPIR